MLKAKNPDFNKINNAKKELLKKELMQINVKVERELWLDFQMKAKLNKSDASKELRKLIFEYCNENGN